MRGAVRRRPFHLLHGFRPPWARRPFGRRLLLAFLASPPWQSIGLTGPTMCRWRALPYERRATTEMIYLAFIKP